MVDLSIPATIPKGTRDRPPTDAQSSATDAPSERDALSDKEAPRQDVSEPNAVELEDERPALGPELRLLPQELPPPSAGEVPNAADLPGAPSLATSASAVAESRLSPAVWAVVAAPALRRQSTQLRTYPSHRRDVEGIASIRFEASTPHEQGEPIMKLTLLPRDVTADPAVLRWNERASGIVGPRLRSC